MDDMDRMMLRYQFAVTNPRSHAIVTGVDGSKRAVREALSELEEHHPEEAALLREHVDCGRSTDPKWQDDPA